MIYSKSGSLTEEEEKVMRLRTRSNDTNSLLWFIEPKSCKDRELVEKSNKVNGVSLPFEKREIQGTDGKLHTLYAVPADVVPVLIEQRETAKNMWEFCFCVWVNSPPNNYVRPYRCPL